MKIIVQREPTPSISGSFASGHVTLFAIADEDEVSEIKSRNGHTPKMIVFDYTPSNHKTIFNVVLEDYSKSRKVSAAANRVVFDSSVAFDVFLKAMMLSQYKNNMNYSTLNNNCVHAVLFALTQAGIHIQQDHGYQFKHLLCCFWCPSKIITPKNLIKLLQEYQDQPASQPLYTNNELIKKIL